MSRIGKQPIEIPGQVTITFGEGSVEVKGPKGALSAEIRPEVQVTQEGSSLVVSPKVEGQGNNFWGLTRALLNNMVLGVSQGFTKSLEIKGVGYRSEVAGRTLKLSLGFSHPVEYPIPEGIEIKCDTPTLIHVSGANKERVGQVCAEIRAFRPPEPYKGKGVRYVGEHVAIKEGKKAK
ncbi:MAG: 50S ribosomal protein L6 [Alphaproteobacteria bacterium CG_4_10_14_0_2_um_filter_63_37]|nr:MAG: 50S ribosomal protein L6 [Proteobacteria bacterium CG1_02_64_396]PJA25567.1 MAG: 50S ribosomal protein L6 [Alphaproteobacteria bacterium CG_4_10_14_0_2_um_filter_63_37]